MVEGILTLRDTQRSLRESTRTGERVIVAWPPHFKLAGKNYVLLVHGFNVSQADAYESYAYFRSWLEQFQVSASILQLHWPGNQRWGRWSNPFSYPKKISVADDCGSKLGEWIAATHEHARFTLVGHSLGCRVIVSAVNELRAARQSRRIIRVCLMAAAVPQRFISPRRFGPRNDELIQWRILHSLGDTVLRGAFKPGQALGLDGVFDEAVGLYGSPELRWNAWNSDSFSAFQEDGYYDHGDYWRGGLSKKRTTEVITGDFVRALTHPAGTKGASAWLLAEMLGAAGDRQSPVRNLQPPRHVAERQYFGISPP
jgi:pimeloyl-ACP methyl ester carboxylesterase